MHHQNGFAPRASSRCELGSRACRSRWTGWTDCGLIILVRVVARSRPAPGLHGHGHGDEPQQNQLRPEGIPISSMHRVGGQRRSIVMEVMVQLFRCSMVSFVWADQQLSRDSVDGFTPETNANAFTLMDAETCYLWLNHLRQCHGEFCIIQNMELAPCPSPRQRRRGHEG